MDRQDVLPRIVLAASLVAGVSYLASSAGVRVDPTLDLVWKGAGVGLLAVYAGLRARTLDGWLIAAVMALGATGDVLLGAAGLVVGALAFLAGHVVAIWLYRRHRRPRLTRSQALFALTLVPATVVIAFSLPADRAAAPGIALYSTGLALMAASAWTSRFPRFGAGLGAVMFLVSDLLIFARLGPLAGRAWVGPAIWGLYYFGQALICIGVTGRLAWSNRAATA